MEGPKRGCPSLNQVVWRERARGSDYGSKVVIQADPTLCVRTESRLLAPQRDLGPWASVYFLKREASPPRAPASESLGAFSHWRKLVVLMRLPLSLYLS